MTHKARERKDHSDYVHRGGCGLCRWWRDGKCAHPQYPALVEYIDARKPHTPCGPGGHLWEY